MSTLLLSVGIAVTFLTVWGVIMVGGYLLGREPADTSATPVSGRTIQRSISGESDLVI